MNRKSNLMSFIAVSAICLTLFSFKNHNEVEKELGISKEVVVADMATHAPYEQKNLLFAFRALTGAYRLATFAYDAYENFQGGEYSAYLNTKNLDLTIEAELEKL